MTEHAHTCLCVFSPLEILNLLKVEVKLYLFCCSPLAQSKCPDHGRLLIQKNFINLKKKVYVFWITYLVINKSQHLLSGCYFVCVCSVVSDSLWPPGLDRLPGSFFYGIFMQEYWSRLPFPPSGDLPDPRIKPVSLAFGRQILYHRATWESPGAIVGISYLLSYSLLPRTSHVKFYHV